MHPPLTMEFGGRVFEIDFLGHVRARDGTVAIDGQLPVEWHAYLTLYAADRREPDARYPVERAVVEAPRERLEEVRGWFEAARGDKPCPAPAQSRPSTIEKVLTVTARHLCTDGLDYAEPLVGLGSNHGHMAFGWILLIPEEKGRESVPMVGWPCPDSLIAVSDAARGLGCEWLILENNKGGSRLEGLPIHPPPGEVG